VWRDGKRALLALRVRTVGDATSAPRRRSDMDEAMMMMMMIDAGSTAVRARLVAVHVIYDVEMTSQLRQ
jgi:hypothetical protein